MGKRKGNLASGVLCPLRFIILCLKKTSTKYQITNLTAIRYDKWAINWPLTRTKLLNVLKVTSPERYINSQMA